MMSEMLRISVALLVVEMLRIAVALLVVGLCVALLGFLMHLFGPTVHDMHDAPGTAGVMLLIALAGAVGSAFVVLWSAGPSGDAVTGAVSCLAALLYAAALVWMGDLA